MLIPALNSRSPSMGKQRWNGIGKAGAATSTVRLLRWEHRAPPGSSASLRARCPPRRGPRRCPAPGSAGGHPPFHQRGWGDPTQGLGSTPAAWLTSNAAAERGFSARCQSPPRAGPETPAPPPRSAGIACLGHRRSPGTGREEPSAPTPPPGPALSAPRPACPHPSRISARGPAPLRRWRGPGSACSCLQLPPS